MPVLVIWTPFWSTTRSFHSNNWNSELDIENLCFIVHPTDSNFNCSVILCHVCKQIRDELCLCGFWSLQPEPEHLPLSHATANSLHFCHQRVQPHPCWLGGRQVDYRRCWQTRRGKTHHQELFLPNSGKLTYICFPVEQEVSSMAG